MWVGWMAGAGILFVVAEGLICFGGELVGLVERREMKLLFRIFLVLSGFGSIHLWKNSHIP